MPEEADQASVDEGVTRLVSAIEDEAPCAEEILPMVYDQLRCLARRKMAGEAPGNTLQATALVHEAYIRLAGQEAQDWQNRGHFFVAAAEAMRRILVDRARGKAALKRGGPNKKMIDIDLVDIASEMDDDIIVRVDEALSKLDSKDKPAADLVRLRFFVGLSHPEAAAALGVSERTAKRTWAYARAWLYDEIGSENAGHSPAGDA